MLFQPLFQPWTALTYASNRGSYSGCWVRMVLVKTTLIKMLSTLIEPTSGSATVNGFDLSQETGIKASIGLVTSDERSFYWRLTGRQNLVFFAHLHGLSKSEISERVSSVLEDVDLEEVADHRFLTYSTGVRQRLSIARALLNKPQSALPRRTHQGAGPNRYPQPAPAHPGKIG